MKGKRKHGKIRGLTATECLAMFDDLPDGAALSAGAELYGKSYGDFITALGDEASVEVSK